MLKKIPSDYSYDLIDDVLIKGSVISDVSSVLSLREKAMREAESIVNIARANGEKLSQKGYREGYIEGMILAFTHVIDAIEKINTSVEAKQQEILDNVRAILKTSCEDPTVIISVFDEWVKTLPATYDDITLHLPADLVERHSGFAERLLALQKETLKVNYHEGDKIVMCSGEYIAELSPPGFSNKLSEKLTQLIVDSEKERDELTTQAFEKIIRLCSDKIDAPLTENIVMYEEPADNGEKS